MLNRYVDAATTPHQLDAKAALVVKTFLMISRQRSGGAMAASPVSAGRVRGGVQLSMCAGVRACVRVCVCACGETSHDGDGYYAVYVEPCGPQLWCAGLRMWKWHAHWIFLSCLFLHV